MRLFRGARHSGLECNLLVCKLGRSSTESFEKAEAYDALSYTWGSQQSSFSKIKIIANNTTSTLPIGKNLDAALRQLRDEMEPGKDFRDIWVDAICINQADKEEKSVQIPLMRDIYNDAACVRVWLGPEEGNCARAMDFMRECTDTERFDDHIRDAIATPLWDAVSALMRRPWFSRRWIIQEIALARKAEVHCGTKKLAWREFACVIGMLADHQPQLRKLFRESSYHKNHPDYLGDLSELGAIRLADLADNLLLKDTTGKIDGRSLSLEALVASLTAFEASEPHDVIYAILWLANDAKPVTKNRVKPGDIEATPDTSLRRLSASSRGSEMPQGTSQNNSTGAVLFAQGHLDGNSAQSPGPSSHYTPATPDDTPIAMSPPSLEELEGAEEPSAPTAVPKFRFFPPPIETREQVAVNANTTHPVHLTPSPTMQTFGHRRSPSIGDVSGETAKKHAAISMLLEKLDNRRIVVDYELSAFEVYKNFLDLALRQSKSLDILCIPWAPNDPHLPSWIPQLSKNAFGYNNRRILRRKHADPLVTRPGNSSGQSKPYWAAGSLPADCRFGGRDGKSLLAKGFVLDRIKELGKEAVDAVIPSDWMDAVGWTDQTKAPPEEFWRTLVGNKNSTGDAYAPMHWEIACKDAFKRRTNGGPLNTSDILFDCPNNVRKFLERVQRVIWSRRLSLLERHHKTSIALTPAESQEGDLICILHGCSVPVVLREVVVAQPTVSKDMLVCYNCGEQSHATRLCKRAHNQTKVRWNAAKYAKFGSAGDAMQASEPALRNSRKRRGSDPIPAGPEFKRSRRTHYQLIGECYVHRMMNGEAFRRPAKDEVRSQDSIFWQPHDRPRTFNIR